MRMFKLVCVVSVLLVMPLLGMFLVNVPITPYLKFPPPQQVPTPNPFSWLAFTISGVLIAFVMAPVLKRFFVISIPKRSKPSSAHFPWWGWIGLAIIMIAWVLAWSRFSWFQSLQIHTFTPLWIGYILGVNALTFKRTTHCLLINRPRFFLALFPLSAGFWWLFEYLNRFGQNWYYLGVHEFDGATYFWFSSISFSTVLPAVLGTCEYLYSFPRLNIPFQSWRKISFSQGSTPGWTILLFACLGLMGVALRPELCYPLVWISPLFIVIGFQHIFGERNVLVNLRVGDWRSVVVPALAGLICGVFWEMWNYFSLAHWKYAIPFLHGIQIFEMPLLGYSGYFPFGLTCIAFVQFILHETSSPEPMPLAPHRV